MIWGLLQINRWTLADLARQIHEDGARVARWAYGDRKPGRRAAAALAGLGIAVEAWDAPMPPRWRLPHAETTKARAARA